MDPLLLVIIIILALITILVARRLLTVNATHAAWSQIATRTGLEYDHQFDSFGKPYPLSLTGTYRDRKISLAYKTERSEDDGSIERYIRIWIEIKSSSYGYLELNKRWNLKNTFIHEDIDDWEEDFRRRFYIWSDPIDFTDDVFASAELCRKLVIGPTPDFIISRQTCGLESTISRRNKGVDYWLPLIENLCAVTQAVEDSFVNGGMVIKDDL